MYYIISIHAIIKSFAKINLGLMTLYSQLALRLYALKIFNINLASVYFLLIKYYILIFFFVLQKFSKFHILLCVVIYFESNSIMEITLH